MQFDARRRRLVRHPNSIRATTNQGQGRGSILGVGKLFSLRAASTIFWVVEGQGLLSRTAACCKRNCISSKFREMSSQCGISGRKNGGVSKKKGYRIFVDGKCVVGARTSPLLRLFNPPVQRRSSRPPNPPIGGPRPTLGAQVSLKLLFGYVTIFSSANLFTTDLNCRKKLACDIISECNVILSRRI